MLQAVPLEQEVVAFLWGEKNTGVTQRRLEFRLLKALLRYALFLQATSRVEGNVEGWVVKKQL